MLEVARERGDGLAAVGLVPHDDDGLAACERGVTDVGGRRARCEPVVHFRVGESQRRRRLTRAEQGARHHGVRFDSALPEVLPQRACLVAPVRCERAELVGLSRRCLRVADDHELHSSQDNRVMTRFGEWAGAVAGFALTAELAFDGGGFQPAAYDRALVGLSAAALLLVVLGRGARPGRLGGVVVGGLAVLTAWTAASWLWSDSPPLALQEAQRAAAYLAAAAAVVLAGRRVPMQRLAAGIVAGATVAVTWNLVLRLAPDWSGRSALRTDIGQLADPVGYANSLALLAALAFLLALGLDGPAVIVLVPLAAGVALQQSTGTVLALATGLLVYILTTARPVRSVMLVVLPLAGAVVISQVDSVVNPPPTDLLAAAHAGHRLLLLLVALTVVEAALMRASIPRDGYVLSRAARRVAVSAFAIAAVAVPLVLSTHERGRYWRVGLHEIAANPVLGSGAGTYADWWLRLRTVPQSTLEAHSLYLETLAELGPLGLALVSLVLAAGLAGAWRLRRTVFGPALLATLVTYAAAAAADFHWELAAVTGPAICVAASAAVHADKVSGLVRSRYAIPILGSLAAAGVLALAGNVALDSGRPGRALLFAPYSADAWTQIGRSRAASGDVHGAIAAYRQAVTLDPNDWRAWNEQALLMSGEPRRLALARAARLNPFGVPR